MNPMVLLRKILGVAALGMALLVCATTARGQGSATLTGRVLDPKGLAVAAAKLEAINSATEVHYSGETNADGFYIIPGLPPGVYRLVVEKPGFKSILKPEITLHVEDVINLNVNLQVGSASETITVEAGADLVNTTDASVSTVVDRQFAENLPLNGRSFQSLLDLTPGVALNVGSGVSGSHGNGSGGQFTVDGQRAGSNYWMVDGVSANVGMNPFIGAFNGSAGALGAFNVLGGTSSLVSVDALQEFRIQTSTYAPEFGRKPGGQVSIVTRSGTNQFHGTVFNYLRNTVFDAEDWFASAAGLPKAPEIQNDFGGVVGGPVIKDKTFFFFSYEGLRLRLPQTVLTTVPDMTARQSAIPAMQPWINAYPLPDPGAADLEPGLAPFNASFSNPATVDAYSIRVDHALTKSWNLFGRYNYSPSSFSNRATQGLSANSPLQANIDTSTVTAGATWTKSAQVVNEVRFNYSSSGGECIVTVDTFGGATVPPGASLLPSQFSLKNGAIIPDPAFGTDMLLFQGFDARNIQHQYNVVDSLSVQRGPHSLKFGFDFRRLSPYLYPVGYRDVPVFGDLQSLEQGQSFLTITENVSPATFLFHNLGVFAQDTWRVSPRLTLTYGLRWDLDFTPTVENGLPMAAITGFSFTDLSNLALAPAGTSIYGTKYGSFAPRVGAAYQISRRAERALVFRGGFGIFYDLASSEVGNINDLYYPYEGGGDFTSYGSLPYVPFPTPPSVAASIPVVAPNATNGETLFGFDPHLNVPYVLEWSAALEQGLGKSQTLTVSYVGSSGRRLMATEVVTAPNANYAQAELVAAAGNSDFNSLQVQFRRRLSRGLQALGSYSWSHSIDTGSYGGYTDGSFANINVNRGDSDFDVRHSFSGALTYDVPEVSKNAFAKVILGGWSTENIIQAHSAPPISVVDGAYAALTTQNTSIVVRPDVVAGQPFYLYGPQYPGGKALNPDAFANPPTGTTGLPLRQGDLGRNSLRGFGLTQWDFAVHRDFPLRERLKLQFRAEMFNVLNHPNFGPYDVNFGVSDPYFGRATSMLGASLQDNTVPGTGGQNSLYAPGGPRSIQLALKLVF
jgi:hypothetical protein